MSPYRPSHLQRPNDGHIRFFPDEHYVACGSGSLPISQSSGKMPKRTRTETPITDEDAEVIWTCPLPKKDCELLLAKDAAVARRAAILAGGFRCIVIRAREHNTMNDRDKYGKLVMTSATCTGWTQSGKQKPNQVPSDWHMTVAMGDSFEKLHIHGHLFLYPFGDNEGELMEDQPEVWREYHKDDFERTQFFEFWTLPGVVIKFKSTERTVMA